MAGPYATDDIRNYFGVGVQVAGFGTGVAPALFVPYTGEITPDHGMEGDQVYESSSGPYEARAVKTKHKPKGTFTAPVRPSTFAKLAAYMMGADSVAAAGSLFDHTAKLAQPPVYLSAEWSQSGEIVERVTGSVINKLTLTSPDANGELMAEFGFVGAVPTPQGSAATPAYETGMHGVTPGAPYRPSDAAYKIDNATVTNINSWELVLDWGVNEDIYTSSYLRAAFVKEKMTATIKVKFLELDTTQYRKVNYGSSGATATIPDFLDGTSSSFQAALVNGLATTNLRQLTLDIPHIQWRTAPRKLQAAGGTSMIEMTGDLRWVTPDLLTIVSRTADTTAYV